VQAAGRGGDAASAREAALLAPCGLAQAAAGGGPQGARGQAGQEAGGRKRHRRKTRILHRGRRRAHAAGYPADRSSTSKRSWLSIARVPDDTATPGPRLSGKFFIDFLPERWNSLTRFLKLVGPPFPTSPGVLSGAHAASGHLSKYDLLADLANRLAPHLSEDLEELHREGFTPAVRSREFAALTETLICTLYSALDGLRDTLYEAYRKVSGVQRKSTKELFKRAAEKTYGPGFPEATRVPLAEAHGTWFPRLREIRIAVTHGETGFCHLDTKTTHIAYLHGRLKSDDIVAEVNADAVAVRKLIEEVFSHLCTLLEPIPRKVICGTYKARFYEREVIPGPGLTFASGRCLSRKWFETESGRECPLRTSCGAYSWARDSNPTDVRS
jgi:hypothetical protein